MCLTDELRKQDGFSLTELLMAMIVMAIIVSAVLSQVASVFRVSNTTYEMTDAQQGLRTAQEYINRDLVSTGDGLRGINNVRLPLVFVQDYVTTNPVTNPSDPNYVTLPIITSDNDVAAATAVGGANPPVNLLAGADRLTIMMIDSRFAPVSLPATAINSTGSNITLTPQQLADNDFQTRQVYFINSEYGATFAAITSLNLTDPANPKLAFGNADPCGFNVTGTSGSLRFVARGAANQPVPTSLMRMQMIQYFVNENGSLVRRLFGTGGNTAFTDSVIAENVTNFQLRYFLDNAAQPVTQLATAQQQVAVRQVEVSIDVRTTHAVVNGAPQTIGTTTSTSVRNLQFRQAL